MQNIAISYFSLWQFIEAVPVIVVAIVFVIFVDAISIAAIISPHLTTEVTAIIFKYLLFSQIHVLVFEL